MGPLISITVLVALVAVAAGQSTEELREALTHDRGLFDELVTKSSTHEVR